MPVTSGCIYSRGPALGTTKVKSYNVFAALNGGITIDAKLMGNNYICDEGDDQYLAINCTGGNIPIISGTPGRKIEVHNFIIASTGATSVSFMSSTGTIISGPINLAANGQVSLDGNSMDTNVGEGLNINSTANITVTGSLAYRLI